MNFPFYIAKRYALSFSKSTAINIITGIASLGIIVSAMALFVVMSVFSGLKEFSLSFSNSTDPDLKIEASKGKSFILSTEQVNQLKKSTNFSAFSKIVEERVFFLYDEKEQVAYLKGVDSFYSDVTTFNEQLYAGSWIESETNQAIIGAGIMRKLSIGLLDFNNRLEVIAPKPKKGQISSEDDFKRASLIPVGVYSLNDEIDNKYVYCDIEIAQELLGFKPNQVTNVEFKINPNSDEEKAIAELKSIFKNQVTIKNRAQLNDSLYKMLNTENIAVYLIFTLVIIIALFNLIGALIMMIIDKKANLKTLYNLGVEVKQLRGIFFFQGGLLTFFGGLIGLIFGVLIVVVQQQFSLVMVNESLAYPVVFEVKNILIVISTIYILGIIASWIASSTVSKKLVE
ncbi:FtsX-like permease family protein [uncultured Flavobacterium sp.]|uniref:ABC transporter permease n=1 Tax=uncultured Flavobacterium sp. TaxID=165435 RepID=UPI0030EDAE6A